MADKLKGIAAKQLNVLPQDIESSSPARSGPQQSDNALPFGRVAGTSHWSPVMLPEGMAPAARDGGLVPPELEPPAATTASTSLTCGFVFDMCGIEIDPLIAQVGRPLYLDARRRTSSIPLIAEGQMRDAFLGGLPPRYGIRLRR
jgi:2-furoyl-CoA dehydrogenase large subunit